MKIALAIEYQGSQYQGWQKQPKAHSVQAQVEQAISKVADQPTVIFCAGRTDSKVHATAQVVHFETEIKRPEKAWVLGVNTHLPDDVRVRWAKEVDETFHARFAATARRYRYFIDTGRVRSAMFPHLATHHPFELDAEKMNEAAQALIGENNFSAFRAAECQSKTPMRCIYHVSIKRQDNWVVMDIAANAFLHHMVRNIIGSLIPVGEGAKPVKWIAELLAGKDRSVAGPTAKPNGLYLIDVTYPDLYDLPIILREPEFCKELFHELD